MDKKVIEIYPKVFVELKPWECPNCTFINENHLYYCEICSHELDHYSIINSNTKYKKINKKGRVYRAFGTSNGIILPVLSCYNELQFKRNINNLYSYFQDRRINGIWLLTTNSDIETITKVLIWTKDKYPDFWVGVNLIGHIPKVLNFLSVVSPDGLWVDNSHLTDKTNQNIPEIVIDQFKRLNWKGLYFGGVLFKYNHYMGDPLKILDKANEYMDVLITSGEGTGIEIELDKIKFIKDNTKTNILVANASGITPENVYKIKKFCNIFVVRSSIVDKRNNIDMNKLDKLIDSIKN